MVGGQLAKVAAVLDSILDKGFVAFRTDVMSIFISNFFRLALWGVSLAAMAVPLFSAHGEDLKPGQVKFFETKNSHNFSNFFCY